MILRVQNSAEQGLDTMCITPMQFSDKAYHMFIATNTFDKVVIELTDEIPTGYVSQLLTKHKVIPIVNEVNEKTVVLLAEIYPDKASELRYAWMRNKNKLNEIIESLRENYHWEEEIRR